MNDGNDVNLQPGTDKDWVVSHKSSLELMYLYGGCLNTLGGRVLLTPKDSKGLSKALVNLVSSSLRKIGCRCVLDEEGVRVSVDQSLHI